MKYGVYIKSIINNCEIWKPASILYENLQDAESYLKTVQKTNPFGEYKIIEI